MGGVNTYACCGQSAMERGVVYLGHIPHGFYEQEMHKYFSQFGRVTRLKLSRSKKVGIPLPHPPPPPSFVMIGYAGSCSRRVGPRGSLSSSSSVQRWHR